MNRLLVKGLIVCASFFLLSPTLLIPPSKVNLSIIAPRELRGRSAVILTRDKGFSAIVHSVKLGRDTLHLDLDKNLLPYLYQLHVSGLKGSLSFFLESGTRIVLDTADVSRSKVSNSSSNIDWENYRDSIQQPSDERLRRISKAENKARKLTQTDSVNYWIQEQYGEKESLIRRTEAFIQSHPHSYVSLYLLKTNWFAFHDKGLFEKMDATMAQHRTYQFLQRDKKNRTK